MLHEKPYSDLGSHFGSHFVGSQLGSNFGLGPESVLQVTGPIAEFFEADYWDSPIGEKRICPWRFSCFQNVSNLVIVISILFALTWD
jgi:hypothetical protein